MSRVVILLIAWVDLFGLSCGRDSSGNEGGDRLAVQESDGSYTFYAGQGIANAVSQGVDLGESYHAAYMALNVPSAMYEAASEAPERVKTVSLETAGPLIAITVHAIGPDSTVTILDFYPGEPWVSGYAQVGTGADNFTMGYFEVIKWNKDPTGTMPSLLYSDIYTTGLLPDSNKPPLKYADNPTSMPLPPNWN